MPIRLADLCKICIMNKFSVIFSKKNISIEKKSYLIFLVVLKKNNIIKMLFKNI